ncbi:hypothetical protein RWD45_14230 [Virgibacillus soli]|uniref:peptidoglycan glycosyltransferase n=1 Tax=Paracerasibacillus soli TaxID=480284 RepID=A0ABU5CT58_9BACI|nr:hypothetical protein [Virgibacillus soli]MDY0409524.1 hypothetical protein [Virgibacillus soli]
MIGYTPELVTGVWTGYDDNRTLEVIAEQSYAKEVWADFMEAFHQDKKDSEFIPPRGLLVFRLIWKQDNEPHQIVQQTCNVF